MTYLPSVLDSLGSFLRGLLLLAMPCGSGIALRLVVAVCLPSPSCDSLSAHADHPPTHTDLSSSLLTLHLPCLFVFSKEELWPHVREFADHALEHVGATLGRLQEAGEPAALWAVHGHYADAGAIHMCVCARDSYRGQHLSCMYAGGR